MFLNWSPRSRISLPCGYWRRVITFERSRMPGASKRCGISTKEIPDSLSKARRREHPVAVSYEGSRVHRPQQRQLRAGIE